MVEMIEDIFRYKRPDPDKLLADGFVCSGGTYRKDVPIMGGRFTAQVTVSEVGDVRLKVCEAESGEEYVLVRVPGAAGGFIGDVRSACEVVLRDIAGRCFCTERLKAEQAKRTAALIRERFGAEPEFLWEKYPNCAVFRAKENGKWFAIIMSVDRGKLGLPGRGDVEIIDLKDAPEHIEQRVDGDRAFPAYHMNKKHWYTVCLDGRISDEEIGALIQLSYESALGKKKK